MSWLRDISRGCGRGAAVLPPRSVPRHLSLDSRSHLPQSAHNAGSSATSRSVRNTCTTWSGGWGSCSSLGRPNSRSTPSEPWNALPALVFGAGAALLLDEFALIVYMRDVYWSDEGRRSIDAVITMVIIVGMLAIPIGVAPGFLPSTSRPFYIAFVLAYITAMALSLLKGKLFTAIFGLMVPPAAAHWSLAPRPPGKPVGALAIRAQSHQAAPRGGALSAGVCTRATPPTRAQRNGWHPAPGRCSIIYTSERLLDTRQRESLTANVRGGATTAEPWLLHTAGRPPHGCASKRRLTPCPLPRH